MYFKLILLSTEDGRCTTETCLSNFVLNVSSCKFLAICEYMCISIKIKFTDIIITIYKIKR